MNRQSIAGIVVGAVAVTAIGTLAGYKMVEDREYAQVLAVTPNYTTVEVPRQQCADEIVSRQKPVKDKHQVTGTVAGAIIGGVLGNQVGDGSGQDIATAAGSVAGGIAGNKVQERIQEGNTEQTVQQVCKTVYDVRQEHDGFLVAYELEGQRHETVMENDPGDRLLVRDGTLVLN